MYLIPFTYDSTWHHPAQTYDEWFHKNLTSVAATIGADVDELRKAFADENPLIRAWAYEALGQIWFL